MITWNVFRNEPNKKEIYIFNVFDHLGFLRDVNELLKNKELDREAFSEQLRRSASYYFWAKAEHEIVITSWPPYISKQELERLKVEDRNRIYFAKLETSKKADIYEQLRLNWDRFVDYVYQYKEG